MYSCKTRISFLLPWGTEHQTVASTQKAGVFTSKRTISSFSRKSGAVYGKYARMKKQVKTPKQRSSEQNEFVWKNDDSELVMKWIEVVISSSSQHQRSCRDVSKENKGGCDGMKASTEGKKGGTAQLSEWEESDKILQISAWFLV